ncbi:MAG: SDR family oxidoreductase [Bacteroidota bacterium]
MKILLTGANGYIGKRLLPVLLSQGHEVICCIREKSRFNHSEEEKNITIWEHDFLESVKMDEAPTNIDAAYYLIHSMSSSISDFSKLETQGAENFKEYIDQTEAKQIIYLSGITNQDKLSKHLESRRKVENILATSSKPLTTLKAGIIIGSGSASFEIIRDLVEKLPVMVAPRWLKTQSQPIAIRNVIEYLSGVLLIPETFNQSFDIGGPELLTYKQILLKFAKVRGLKRYIFTLPIMTPRLSSYWLYFVTSTSYKLAVNLVDSLKVNIIANDELIKKILTIDLIPYESAVKMAFERLENHYVLSSWKDALISSNDQNKLSDYLKVPSYGCYKDIKRKIISGDSNKILQNIWSVGGNRGWYYANFLWKMRGSLDKMVGGVGLRRGRTNENQIENGDVIDFWRVLVADKEGKRLLLYAEMKLPGEAWLEFSIENNNGQEELLQTATFRPHGLWGRIYWWLSMPFHHFIFKGMINNLHSYG